MHPLHAESISYHYPDHNRLVVRDLTLSAEPGKLVQLEGRNGSGKTTALRILAGELEPISGKISNPSALKILYLDQKASAILAPDLTVEEHLRTFRGKYGYHETLSDATKFELNLERLVPKFTGQLSGGERQIFALLCALGGLYDILLLDEFTSNLDLQSERIAFELVTTAVQHSHIGAVLVSHRKTQLHIDKTITMEVCPG